MTITSRLNDFFDHYLNSGSHGDISFFIGSLRTILEKEYGYDFVSKKESRDYLTSKLNKLISSHSRRHKGIGFHGIISENYLPFLLKRLEYSTSLIKLRKEEQINNQLAKFVGWASGSPIKETAKDLISDIGKSKQQVNFERRRVDIDQSHKLASSIDDAISEQYGAIARKWRHVIPHAGYDSRKEHLERNHKIYAIKGRSEDLGNGFWEDLPDFPAELPFCRCWAESIYTERDLARAMK